MTSKLPVFQKTVGAAKDDQLERQTIALVARRLLPLLTLCYFAAYLDRVNVGFAALTMNQALRFNSDVFGIGSGIFFIGYFLFEIPSNLLLQKFGARRWIARILITWGIISGLTAFVWNASSFYTIRFLLGLAEAGFYPGIILYLTWWFPARYRSRIIGIFMTAIPFATISGSIISAQILSLNCWLGLQGWQWLFILEAAPAVVLGLVVMYYLTDTPAQANWLSTEQRAWLTARLDAERAEREAKKHSALGETFRNGRVWLLTLVYFGQNVSLYGFALFLPQIVARFGGSIAQTGIISAIPYIFAAIAMVLWGLHADRTGRPGKQAAAACFLTFIGLAACAFVDDPVLKMTALVVAQIGQYSIAPIFWNLPTSMLSGTAAAGGIAMINAVGNLGGFVGPSMMGVLHYASGSFGLGLLAIATGALVSGVVLLALERDQR